MSFNFKHPSRYKKTNINIDKAIVYPERELDKKGIMELASETGEEEFELDLTTGLLEEFKEALEENPGLKFKDFLSSRRQNLNAGGVTGDTLAENYADLIDSWVRKIDLASPDESLTEYINRVRKSEAKAAE